MKKIIYAIAMVTLLAFPSLGQFSAQAQRKTSKRRPKVIRLEEFKVEGKIQKPEAFIILQRRQLNFEGLDPKQSFIPLIIKSVDKVPF
jgi:hypothetical protein